MIILGLVIIGLICGSFVNALVWRLYEQSKAKNRKTKKEFSILSGRSMCPKCKHQLFWPDLIPVFSWLSLRGHCRYCQGSISWQYPIVELITALLFTFSYIFWPKPLHGIVIFQFIIWCLLLIGFVALAVYDLRWYLLPNRIVYPLFVLALLEILAPLATQASIISITIAALVGLAIGGGLFYLLFVISNGSWIGGGDVRLGGLLGLIVGGPFYAMLMLIIASGLGTFISIPLLLTGKANRKSHIPFGPMLILGGIIAELFGGSIFHWSLGLFS